MGSVGHKWTSYKSQETPTCPNCLSVLSQFKIGVDNPTIQERLKELIDEKVCTHMGFFAAAVSCCILDFMSLSYVTTLYAKYIYRHIHYLSVSHTHGDMVGPI